MKVGFIGLGNMGSALAKGIAILNEHELLFSNHNLKKAADLEAQIGGQILSNSDLVREAEVVFLGVKPHLVGQVLSELTAAITENKKAIWISMAAGVSLSDLAMYLPADCLVRMMPNTPVAIGQGMTTFSVTNPELVNLVVDLLGATGQVKQVPEQLIDTATAIAGCGPAFVYVFIDALTEAGVQNGLSVADAKFLVSQTLIGAAQMVQTSNLHPAQLRDQVTSPGGSTIAGLVALEENNFRFAVIDAVNEALAKTKELGK